MQNVALIGLGIMGAGMAHNLLKAGFPLVVYNRTREKAEALVADGARLASTPAEAASGVDVVLSMVGDDAASRWVWLGSGTGDGALDAAKSDAVLIEVSTLSVDWSRELIGEATKRGKRLLDAPVTGSKEAAQTGGLRFLVGGDAATLEQVRPVFMAMGQQILHVGPSGAGTILKLINNMMGAVHAAALAEGLALAEKAGLDKEMFLNFVTGGPVASAMVKMKAPRMVARNYDATDFSLRWMHKDTIYALQAAAALGLSLPTVQGASQVFQQARGLGLDDADMAAVFEGLNKS